MVEPVAMTMSREVERAMAEPLAINRTRGSSQSLAKPIRRSFCRRRSGTFTEVARLVPPDKPDHASQDFFEPQKLKFDEVSNRYSANLSFSQPARFASAIHCGFILYYVFACNIRLLCIISWEVPITQTKHRLFCKRFLRWVPGCVNKHSRMWHISYHTILYCVMLCYVMLCYAILHYLPTCEVGYGDLIHD